MLSIHGLSKKYGNGVCALHNVSLEIPKGMFGLLGPNGAGKLIDRAPGDNIISAHGEFRPQLQVSAPDEAV